ncbi:MAG: hypothetical protein C0404_02225 [Verrucomicrobia bacterium]|nr:hypothetical protein [Verrucomicrobiota bacterium]
MMAEIQNGSGDRKGGMALVTVMCTLLLLSSILAVLVMATGTHMKIAGNYVDQEKAFFVAEAGLERAGQYIANGGTVPGTMCGAIGDGTYVATIISGASITDSWHAVGGQININPNNTPNNEFVVTLQDGSQITRDTLTEDYGGFIGQATLVHIKPKGSGNQNGLYVDAQPYDLENKNSYDILSNYMSVSIYNDNVNTNGKAMGKWWISLAAAEADIIVNGVGSGSGNIGQARVQFSMISVGTVRGQVKVVMRETIKQKTWAKYAMWMNNNNGIYFKAGEKFYGSVYSTEELTFQGDPEFFAECKSAATTYGGSTNACNFHMGFARGVSNETMAKVSFSNLYKKASIRLEGLTYLNFNTTNILVSNSRAGWTNMAIGCDTTSVIYVQTATGGSASTRTGDVYVAGVLDGRITIAAERDFVITNHILYAVDSKTNLMSDDALGLIAKRDIVIATNCPNDLKIYAHMMATGLYDTNSSTDGSFGYAGYSTGAPRGTLTVHGGVVQDDRGAVGQFNSGTGQLLHGFNKNYTYDTRFENDPPPEYPPLSDQLQFGTWRER